jgi:FkbM family methyltransferase
LTERVRNTAEDQISGDVDPKFVRLARSLVGDRPVICDIGSRDALEGIALMRQLDGKQLHVFEPNPSAARICRQNLSDFTNGDLSEVAWFNEMAVTDRVGQLKFYPVNVSLSDNKDIGFSSLFQINPEYTRRRGRIVQDEVTVNATTLDDYFIGKQNPDILWIDVEGAELQVFRGATRVLAAVKLIHVEVSFRPMQLGKPLFWELSRYLKEQGFSFHSFMEISALKTFLYRYRLLPNLPWRLNAVFCRRRSASDGRQKH